VSKGWRGRGLPSTTRIPRLRRGRISERRGITLPNPLAAPDEVGSRPDVRLWVVGAVFLALFGFMGVRLAFLQIVDHAAYAATVEMNSLRTAHIPAPRGDIIDRTGSVLVANSVHRELVLSRSEALSHPAEVARVAALAGLTPQLVNAALSNGHYDPYQPVPILQDTPTSVIVYLQEHAAEFPGVSVESVTERTYPKGGSLAPQTLGYVAPITTAELAQDQAKGYLENSLIGTTGIEQYYESYLRGTDGVQKILVNALGEPLSTISTVPPKTGDSVVLNLDAGLQNYVTNALAADILRVRSTLDPISKVYPPAPNAAEVVLDPRNGQVLAMVSYPNYSLSVWRTGAISPANYDQLLYSHALDNNAIDGLYTPGSTFKLATATAALNDHVISAYQYINDTGAFKVPGCLQIAAGCVFHDDDNQALGEVDLPMALTESSDYYFYNLGYLFWASYVNDQHYRFGETPIQDVAAAYGLDAPTGIDLPNEAPSTVDSPMLHAQLHHDNPTAYPDGGWYTGSNIEMAFGQGGTTLTPLGLADAYATFANGGTHYQPELAAAVVTPDGHLLQRYGPKVEGHVPLPVSTYDPILQGLMGVVNDPSGTAYGAFHQYAGFNLASFPIAGKTGTASNAPGEEPNSWFVGFGPVGAPRYVVLCVIGQGGYGADAAAPVVAETFNYLVHHPIGPVTLPHGATHHSHHSPGH
jgi:penicillin-binding protein 2